MTARRYRAIFESAVDFAIIAMDREGIVTDWNPGAEQILGWTEEEMKGQPASRFFTRQDNELHIAEGEMATALAEGRASDERWHRKSDGALFWASGEMMPLRDDDGGHLGFLKILRDRTEQRLAAEAQAHAEEALRQGEERWRNLFEQMHEGFFVGEAVRDDKGQMVDFRFLEINAAFQEQTGIKGALNRTIREMTPDMPAEAIATYAAVVDTGEPAQFEIQVESLGRWFEARAQRSGPDRFSVLFLEISERKAAEAAIRVSEQQFRTFAEAMPNHVWTSPPDGLLDWFNQRVYEYSGTAPGSLDGVSWTGMVHPDDLAGAAQRWAEAITQGAPYEVEFRLRRADGVYRWHIARAAPIQDEAGNVTRWIGSNTDIEDQKTAAETLSSLNTLLEARVEARTGELMAAEEALRQSQKMEAVGQLTGGIAHDFNNLLTGVIGGLDLIHRRIEAGRTDGLERFIEAAMTSAQRAAALTHRLLAFARRQSLDTKPQDVNALVSGFEDMLHRTLGETVALETALKPDLWPALTDANQFENALLNLAINARDAMPGGGKLTIETANVSLDAAYAARNTGFEAGEYVVVSVSDTGSGMEPGVIAKAFDPFFTTKPIGQGTGLGLSMIYGFVKQSGGHVRIYSEVGQGTTVKLFLKRADTAHEADAVTAGPQAPRGQGETVLVVEDDPTVRLLVVEVLEELGYQYLEAPDGLSALPFIESGQKIDLLVTDVGLPNMNGRQLAEIAVQKRPGLKVLFITGYAENAAVRGGFLAPGMEMITKPFALDVLAAKIRELIEG